MAIIGEVRVPHPTSLPCRRLLGGELFVDLCGRHPRKDQLAEVWHPELHRVVAVAVEVLQNLNTGAAAFHIKERPILQVIGDDRHSTDSLPLVDLVDEPKCFDGSVLCNCSMNPILVD